MPIHYRGAELRDIRGIQVVRHAVRENRLSRPELLTDEDCAEYLFRRGKGWVAEEGRSGDVLEDGTKVTTADGRHERVGGTGEEGREETVDGEQGVGERRIIGFAIADLQDHNIWALFVDPAYEGRGVGRRLHELMMDWYFRQTEERVWLSTAPGTRAEGFYVRMGWAPAGWQGEKEVRFEMEKERWRDGRTEGSRENGKAAGSDTEIVRPGREDLP